MAIIRVKGLIDRSRKWGDVSLSVFRPLGNLHDGVDYHARGSHDSCGGLKSPSALPSVSRRWLLRMAAEPAASCCRCQSCSSMKAIGSLYITWSALAKRAQRPPNMDPRLRKTTVFFSGCLDALA